MQIFLIGLPGSGKTTLGKALASYLQLPFVDLDHAIEVGEQQQITEIFKTRGETHFRELETQYLQRWISSATDFVMATGGGAPCFNNNLERMKAAGKTIFLDVPAREIVNRMNQSTAPERPLLAGVGRDGLKDRIEFLRTQRLSFYKQAECTATGENITVADLIKTATLP